MKDNTNKDDAYMALQYESKARQSQAWQGISDTLDKMIDVMAKKHNIEVVEEDVEETKEAYLDVVVEHVLDPSKKAMDLKIEQSNRLDDSVDELEESLREASIGLNEAIEALSAPIELGKSKLKDIEFEEHKIKRFDSPLMKLMKKTILKEQAKVEPKSPYTKGYVKEEAPYLPNTPKAPLKEEVSKSEVEVDKVIEELNKRKQLDYALIENVITKSKRVEREAKMKLVKEEPKGPSYTKGYME